MIKSADIAILYGICSLCPGSIDAKSIEKLPILKSGEATPQVVGEKTP